MIKTFINLVKTYLITYEEPDTMLGCGNVIDCQMVG